jgi:hypothetical protein
MKMNPSLVKYISAVQEKIFNSVNRKTDAHYEEGRGILFVPMGAPLERQNVIHAIPWIQVEVSMSSGIFHI